MEVACNMAPFAAASNANLNPIMEHSIEAESEAEEVTEQNNGQVEHSAKVVNHESNDIQNG